MKHSAWCAIFPLICAPPVLDDFGLVTSLCWYVDRYTKRTGLEVDVVIELSDQNQRLSREVETACFRIAQEALTNIVRHAQASQVDCSW